jgi:dolichyl-phosphate-mannose--protein O-mannosyl transferase
VLSLKHISEKYGWIIIIALYFAAECLINPHGEFPLNDDWAYALPVKEYVNTGNLHFSFWQAIPGLSQFLAGVIAAKVFGFSFTLLRLISVACVPLMIFLLERILRRLEINNVRRLVLLSGFVFNPLTLTLSNTWLPDLFQLFLSFAAFAVFIFYINSRKIF